jgi:hypothetical protein
MPRFIGFSFIAALFGAIIAMSAPASAGPAGTLAASSDADASLVQNVGYYKRRWWRQWDDSDNGDTHVRAPTTSVDSNNAYTDVDAPFAKVRKTPGGTWVRAPFVNLFVPRNDWD